MSGEFDSRKDLHSTKFERRHQIFTKLSFRELCDSKLSGLHPFDDMAINHWIKNWSKKGREAYETLIHMENNFCDPHWELICHNKQHPKTLKISTPLEIAVRTFTFTYTPVFWPAYGEASWSLHPSLVSLLSCSTVQPENTYSCILKMTAKVW